MPQGLTYPPLDCRIHQQTQGHDAPGRFQEQGRGHEDRGFQETEPAFRLGGGMSGNWFLENDLAIARLDELSRNENAQQNTGSAKGLIWIADDFDAPTRRIQGLSMYQRGGE